MALLSLQLPSSSPHPQLSLPFHKPKPKPKPKPIFPFHLPSNAQLKRSGRSPHFPLPLSSIATPSSSGSAAATTEEAAAAEEPSEGSGAEGPRTRLIAQNIPWTSTVEDIRSLFERHGTVVDVELSMYNKIRNRGLAFITMVSEEEALRALNNLNSYDLDGRVIKVEFARSLKKMPRAAEIPIPRYNVFVGNLTWRVRSRDLRELFETTGKVMSAEVIFQSNPRRSAGYGFVSFASKEEAEAAISTLNRKRFMGRPIRLILNEPKADDAEGRSVESEQSGVASSEMNANLQPADQADEI